MARIQLRLSIRPAKESGSELAFKVTPRSAYGVEYKIFWKCAKPYLHPSERIFTHKLMICTTRYRMLVMDTNDSSKGWKEAYNAPRK